MCLGRTVSWSETWLPLPTKDLRPKRISGGSGRTATPEPDMKPLLGPSAPLAAIPGPGIRRPPDRPAMPPRRVGPPVGSWAAPTRRGTHTADTIGAIPTRSTGRRFAFVESHATIQVGWFSPRRSLAIRSHGIASSRRSCALPRRHPWSQPARPGGRRGRLEGLCGLERWQSSENLAHSATCCHFLPHRPRRVQRIGAPARRCGPGRPGSRTHVRICRARVILRFARPGRYPRRQGVPSERPRDRRGGSYRARLPCSSSAWSLSD
jgi:hypothetical protein